MLQNAAEVPQEHPWSDPDQPENRQEPSKAALSSSCVVVVLVVVVVVDCNCLRAARLNALNTLEPTLGNAAN